MRLRGYFVFLAVFFVLLASADDNGQITGDTVITGNATSQQTDVSILVFGSAPALSILSPQNGTYLRNDSILLNYSASGIGFVVRYNFDGAANTTITSPIYFNASQGVHTLYMYANNSDGTTGKNVTFTANSSLLTVIYSDWNGSTKGSSTDFYRYTYENLQALSGIVFENAYYGKIKFSEAINITDDSNPADGIVDFDSGVNMALNHIEVDAAQLPNFDGAATVWIYNLSFSNPRILKDGELCEASICTEESYTSGALKFSVTQMGNYSAEETPETIEVEVPGPSTGGGGGGGGSREVPAVANLGLDKTELKVKLIQGETKRDSVIVKNLESHAVTIFVSAPAINEFVKISETSFTLNPNEEKTIYLDFIAQETAAPDLHLGNIIFAIGGADARVLVAIEIVSKQALLDVKADIPEEYMVVSPCGNLLFTTHLYNLGADKKVDVEIDYIIKDDNDRTVYSAKETVAVETQMSMVKSAMLPCVLADGKYALYVRAVYGGQVASSVSLFEVSSARNRFNQSVFLIIIGILLLLFIVREIILKRGRRLVAAKKRRKRKKEPRVEFFR